MSALAVVASLRNHVPELLDPTCIISTGLFAGGGGVLNACGDAAWQLLFLLVRVLAISSECLTPGSACSFVARLPESFSCMFHPLHALYISCSY